MKEPVGKKPARRENTIIPARILLCVLAAFCILLMFFSFRVRQIRAPFRAFADTILAPLENGVSAVGSGIHDRLVNRRTMEELRSENEQLTEELKSLREEKNQFLTQQRELAELRDLFDLDSQFASYETTGARVIAKDSGNWYHSFIINKGEKDGLGLDMNVLAGEGLVGRITDLGAHWARVETIIDDNISVAGMILSTSANLMTEGSLQLYEEGLLSFGYLVDPDRMVVNGDRVVTSNISNKYLPGLLIGYVSEIHQDPNNITSSGTIVPAVDFSSLGNVLVITTTKQQADPESGASS